MEGLKIKKILVPLDFSECACAALDYAVRFAEELHASLVLLNVVEPAVGEHYTILNPMLDERNDHLVEAGRERLTGVTEQQVQARVSVDTLVRIGRAPSEISDTAKALGVDLIIIGTHGSNGGKHALLGSTAEKVVRQAPCPVLTLRSECR